MTVVRTIIAIIMISSCCSADLNFLSFITKFYDTNVKSLKNYFNLNEEDHSDVSVFIYGNEINDDVHEIDNSYLLNNYRRNDDLNGVYQYDEYNTNTIPDYDDDEDVFTPLTSYVDEQEKRSNDLGFFNTILKLFGCFTSDTAKSNFLLPLKASNKTKGLDVRLKSTYFTKMLLQRMKSQFKIIFPGTLWCGGPGTLARTDNDYGLFRRTDKCCWKHDLCPKYIAAGETFKNLENVGIFTRSHCECDRAFYTCLKHINSLISNKIGVTYFNFLRPQCFRKEYPIVSCLEKRDDSSCFNYVIDNDKPKQWQWFDNKIY